MNIAVLLLLIVMVVMLYRKYHHAISYKIDARIQMSRNGPTRDGARRVLTAEWG